MSNQQNKNPRRSKDARFDMLAWLPKEITYDVLSGFSVKELSHYKSVSKSWLSLIGTADFIKTHLAKTRNYDILSWLPKEVMYYVLSRFTVKELLQLRSVCKSWLSIISSRDFVRTHLRISTNDPSFTRHHLLLRLVPSASWVGTRIELRRLSINSLLNEPVTEAVRLPYPTGELRCALGSVVGYCHGLICLAGHINVLLWNPSTRKSRTLPKLEMVEKCVRVQYRLGYDESTDDYKVFSICTSHPIDKFKYRISVYSLKSDCWRIIGDYSCGGKLYCSGKFANNAMNWGFGRPTVELDKPERKVILSLDIKSETFREVLPPKSTEDAHYWTLATFAESISVLCKFSAYADFWVMKEFGVEEPWTKLLTIKYTVGMSRYSDLIPVSDISVNGDIILNLGSGIKLYNSEDNTFKDLVRGFSTCDYSLSTVDTYVESLSSPYL